MSKGWDNLTLKKLKALTGKGLSTSEIGKRLGMSKNAIVGKLNRLGWNSKGAAAKEKQAEKKEKPVKKAATTKKETVTKKVTAAPKKVTVKKNVETVVPKKVADKATKKTPVKESVPKKDVKAVKVAVSKEVKKEDKKVSAKKLAVHQRVVQHSLELASLKPNQCRWPIGDPDSEHFHFCGETVFVGKPYCYEHCKQAYQFAPPKKK